MSGIGSELKNYHDFISYEELTDLALDAAIVFENLLQKRKVSTEPIDRLFQILKESPGFGVANQDRVQHISPMALAVYSRALRQTGETILTLDDITTRIISITQKEDDKKPKSLIEKLRNFCLALHDELLRETHNFENANNWEDRERGSTIGFR